MVEASGVIAQVRSARQLTMNALADVSGVPVSTISRIESGKVEPTWSMMARLVAAAGFRLDPALTEITTDEPFAAVLRRLGDADLGESERIVRRFPAVARLALVARRPGARRVALATPLGVAVAILAEQGQAPVVSSLEAFLRDATQTRSFTPVVYVDDPATVEGFASASPTSPSIMFLLPATDHVRAVSSDVDGVAMTTRAWALLDSLASPGRQPDATMYLIDELLLEPVS